MDVYLLLKLFPFYFYAIIVPFTVFSKSMIRELQSIIVAEHDYLEVLFFSLTHTTEPEKRE